MLSVLALGGVSATRAPRASLLPGSRVPLDARDRPLVASDEDQYVPASRPLQADRAQRCISTHSGGTVKLVVARTWGYPQDSYGSGRAFPCYECLKAVGAQPSTLGAVAHLVS